MSIRDFKSFEKLAYLQAAVRFGLWPARIYVCCGEDHLGPQKLHGILQAAVSLESQQHHDSHHQWGSAGSLREEKYTPARKKFQCRFISIFHGIIKDNPFFMGVRGLVTHMVEKPSKCHQGVVIHHAKLNKFGHQIISLIYVHRFSDGFWIG